MAEQVNDIIGGIVDFWFGAPGTPDYGKDRDVWWQPSEAFDVECRTQLAQHYDTAAQGFYDHWAEDAQAGLALMILLDQAPRNLFRGTPHAFISDEKARNRADQMLGLGLDQALLPIQRAFVYLPFEHSEDLGDQERSVSLFTTLGLANQLDYARRHLDVIAQFGRFPHRNAILGRESTPQEAEFLTRPNSSF